MKMKDQSWQSAAEGLIRLALQEDLSAQGDVTTGALIPADQTARVEIVARNPGVLAGIEVGEMLFQILDPAIVFERKAGDGDRLEKNQVVACLSGNLRSLLIGERTCLNFLTHLSGVATMTCRFVDLVAGTRAGIYDTRKTLPGWRLLEKHAVLAGGGKNHRIGLYDMVLIKDNHLAGWLAETGQSIASAVRAARSNCPAGLRIEVEVDTLEQLTDAIQGQPDIVLLDNMSLDELRRAVAWRDQHAPGVELEASGGVSLATVGEIARTGVERISVGAITHSPPALDLAFDWKLDQP
jgi:nicotinate-nucleotide pyrophosphorylase (carboxylating)